MSAENKDSDNPVENSEPTNEPLEDYQRSDKDETKSGSILSYFKHFPFAVKDAFSAASKAFKGRIKGVPPEEKKDGEEKDALDDESLPGVTKPKETDDESDDESDEEASEEKAQEKESKSKAILKKLSRPRVIVATVVGFVFIISAVGFYILHTPRDKDDSGKVISAESSEKDEAGFFDFLEDIISPFRGKKNTELTAEEQLQLTGLKYTETEFVKQAGRNNVKAVGIFIKGGMSPNTSRKADGVTPLIAAASYDRLEMVTYLLDQGADINLADNDGQTALMRAVKYNRHKVIELLLKRGADYNVADPQGNTAASMANEKNGDNEIVQIFSQFGIDVSAAKKEPPVKKEPDGKKEAKEEAKDAKDALDEILSTNNDKNEISIEELTR